MTKTNWWAVAAGSFAAVGTVAAIIPEEFCGSELLAMRAFSFTFIIAFVLMYYAWVQDRHR